MSSFDSSVFNEDCIAGLAKVPDCSIDMILSDIPYGIGAADWDVLHANKNSGYMGTSPGQERAGAVFKRRGKPINGWSEADRAIPREYYEWCASWANEWFRVLKPGGSAIVFAGRRFSHRCVVALEDSGFNLKDLLSWQRQRAVHRAQRLSVVYERRKDLVRAEEWQGWRIGNLRPTFEPVIWCTKPYKMGSTIADNVIKHGLGAYNEAAFVAYGSEPENVLSAGFSRGETGLHPSQKPLALMRQLIELVTKEGHVVLDPFCGSGSSLVAAKSLNRGFVGFEVDAEYYKVALNRLSAMDDEAVNSLF